MNEQQKVMLEAAGIDVSNSMQRFMGNEELFLKFLKKFPEDPSFAELKKAFDKADEEGVFRHSHTLKGIAGNLGLVNIYRDIQTVVETARWQKLPEQEEMDRLEEVYRIAIKSIAAL